MPILCNLTCGLLLAAALIVPQYASAAGTVATVTSPSVAAPRAP